MKRRLKWVREEQHKLLAYLWVVLTIPALLWWKESVLFVILLSLYANYESSRAAQEARADRRQAEETHTMVLELLEGMSSAGSA